MSFGKFLKEKRIQKKLTLRQMSYKTGFSHTYISDIEKEVSAKPETIEKIADVLEMTKEEKEYILKEIMYFKTPTTVKNELEGLKKQLIEIKASCMYSGEPLTYKEEIKKIPVYGDISAGRGEIVYGDIIDHYPLTNSSKNTDDLIAVRVSGQSMEPQILDGSQVLIRTGEELENRQVGVFCIGEECFVKQFRKYGDHIVLKSFNSSYDDIEIQKEDDFHIIGRVIEGRNKF